MKKILVVDFNGTSALYTHYFSKGLVEGNDEVKILGKKKPLFLDVFEDLNEYLGFNFGFKLLDYVLNWFWLLFNYQKFDTIVIQWLQLLKYTDVEIKLLNYLQSRVKLIYLVHNLYPHNTKDNKVVKRYNQLYQTVKNIAVHTYKVKKIILELSPNTNILSIKHGLFFKEFRPIAPKIILNKCLMIGYISKYKGIEDALEVVKRLKEKGLIISLDIIGLGTPAYLNILIKMIDDFKIKDQVFILSKEVPTSFLIDKINESTMLWLPYKKISQSGVAYTSTGLGKPFVGYDVGDFKDSFGDNGLAEIVKKDSIEDFSEAVIEVLYNQDFYEKNIQKFSLNNLWNSNEIILNLNFKS
jgi:glycosyltransferase involved in cell wall biosynthesis